MPQMMKLFKKNHMSALGYESKCNRCHTLIINSQNPIKIVGKYCLLTENPNIPLKQCECCGVSAQTTIEMDDMFRKVKRASNKPSTYINLCKNCENVATLMLSEMEYRIKQDQQLIRGSLEYLDVLERLFKLSGYSEVPKDAHGLPTDVLKYPLRFCRKNGQPFVPSAAKIRQIKIKVGYMPKEETRCTIKNS